jgi:phage terminase large subunit-like protein
MTWIAPALALVLVIAHQIAYGSADAAQWTFGIGFVVYAAVGGLIADRHPRNPVGWLFCVVGVVFAAGDFVSDYADHGNPGATPLAVLNNATGPSSLGILMLALMLFPTGRFLSAGWRRAGVFVIAANVALGLVLALEPGRLTADLGVENPLGVDAAAGLLHALADAGGLVIAVTVLIAIAAVVARFRAARGIERQQLKWLALLAVLAVVVLALLLVIAVTVLIAIAAVVARFRAARGIERQQLKWLALLAVLGVAVLALLLVTAQFVNLDTGTGQVLAGVVLGLLSMAPALAAAVAILRYRLYDVDVVINRALVYGALTALLGATYLGLVLLIGLAVGQSGFAVAASTLAVAALFRPARARVQAAVDRRFYRRRYDAAQALAGFGARLRDQVELDALSHELRGVVDECLQPAHVSLWLRAVR